MQLKGYINLKCISKKSIKSGIGPLDLTLTLVYFAEVFLCLVAVEQIQRAENASHRAGVTRYKCAK